MKVLSIGTVGARKCRNPCHANEPIPAGCGRYEVQAAWSMRNLQMGATGVEANPERGSGSIPG